MNKIVLITGATSGIGEACARLFASHNYDLIITGRRAERLKKLEDELSTNHPIKVKSLTFDVRNNQEVINNLGSLSEDWQHIDVLINNAGLSMGLDRIDEGSVDDWDTMIDTNVKGLLYVTKVISGWMVKNKSGHIINIGSIAGKENYANGNVYCASKHAVDSLNKAMRIDLLHHHIKVTAIHPGAVETEFSEVRFKGDKDRAKKVYEGFTALTGDDVADVIWYAVSLPAHVNINDLVIMPTAQANTTYLIRQ
ncbi:MAG TPA: SDR family NAD(P)-dependent oxidoreductase [Sphingobacteriaceae bacterium]|nr:SDR family NAD(P)-dependent oxidoreductase [Sphingobacteriaceae bacterium]